MHPSAHLANAHQLHTASRKPSGAALVASRIRDISVQVYCKRLGPKCAERMLSDDADGGVKMRGRAAYLDSIVRAVLEIKEIAL